MYEIDLFRDFREIERVLDGGISASDHCDLAVAVESAVAVSAVMHTAAEKLILSRKTEPSRICARSDDHRSGEQLAGVGLYFLDITCAVKRDDLAVLGQSSRRLGTLLHSHRKLESADTLVKAGVILDNIGDCRLTSCREALNHESGEPRPRGVQCGGVACRASSYYDSVVYSVHLIFS